MLRSVKEMTGYTVRATDGDIGRVADFFFDTDRWTVRYVVVTIDGDTGGGAGRTSVLISPMAVTNPDFDAKRFDVSLARQQVLSSPNLEGGQAVSREWEEQYADYYHLPRYWGGTGLWGAFTNALDAATAPLAGFPLTPAQTGAAPEAPPAAVPDGQVTTVDARSGGAGPEPEGWSPAPVEWQIRSAREFMGSAVEASDGSAGTVEDLLVDDRSWQVLHVVVDTTRWLPGGEVVVPADMATGVDWAERQIKFDLTRDEIKRRAEFRPAS